MINSFKSCSVQCLHPKIGDGMMMCFNLTEKTYTGDKVAQLVRCRTNNQ